MKIKGRRSGKVYSTLPFGLLQGQTYTVIASQVSLTQLSHTSMCAHTNTHPCVHAHTNLRSSPSRIPEEPAQLLQVTTNKRTLTLAGVAQCIECQPANQKAAGSIPSQGICLICRPGPQLRVCERQPFDVFLSHGCSSPSFSPSLPLSLKINK